MKEKGKQRKGLNLLNAARRAATFWSPMTPDRVITGVG